MLPRDRTETERLEIQHKFLIAMVNGHLVHPSIPRKALQSVADVGTGTGAWLRDLANELDQEAESKLIGFDISGQQFPPDPLPNQDFVVHDMTTPFPTKYLGHFHLVNVRLLSYALKAQDLEQSVRNVVAIMRKLNLPPRVATR